MFRYLQLKVAPHKPVEAPGDVSLHQLVGDSGLPIGLRVVNDLPPEARRRLYRVLLPPGLLAEFGVHPVSWKDARGAECVRMTAESGNGALSLQVFPAGGADAAAREPFLVLELADNNFNGLDLNWLVLSDPHAARYQTDRNADGSDTELGAVSRNRAAEEEALAAGLAPGQVRAGLRAGRHVLAHLDTFLAFLGHQAVFLEPLTYASAWVFERHGFAYVRGHKLMDDIHREFQPGGRLHQGLDGSTPFRRPDHWRTVRGRAWAIHDGLLHETLGVRWNDLRMVRQVGRHAGVETFPGAIY